MTTSLVIVESPAKARTIARFLGDGYVVMASMGHVRDLEAKGLAVDVDNHFKPTYTVNERAKPIIRDLKAALKDADEIFLATDEDREGEAISWHLLEVLKPRVPVRRMVFHEITRQAIERSRRRPGESQDRRPAVRLPRVRGVLAQDPNRPVRRPRAEPGGPPGRRT
jgi:DNA topoisomerase-1